MAFVSVGGDRGGAGRNVCGFGLSFKFLLLIGLIAWFSSPSLVTGLKCYKCMGPECVTGLGQESSCDAGDSGCLVMIDVEGKGGVPPKAAFGRGCEKNRMPGCLDETGGLAGVRECFCLGDLCNTNEADIMAMTKVPPVATTMRTPKIMTKPSKRRTTVRSASVMSLTENTNSDTSSASGSASPPSNSTAAKPGSSSAPTRHPKRIDWIVLVTFFATSLALFTNKQRY